MSFLTKTSKFEKKKGKIKNKIIGIILIKKLRDILKLFSSIFLLAKFGRRNALKLLEMTLSLPVSCCGTE